MTKSSRQDTSKAARSAETEPAATASAAQEEAAAEPEAAAETPAEGSAAPDEAQDTAKPDLDETKRKFREALDRKHQVHNEGQGQGKEGKIHGAHGPAASRRSFRRKSG